jgi:hypothetical protein
MEHEVEEEADRYAHIGEHDNLLFSGWPGEDVGAPARRTRPYAATDLRR